MHIIITALYCKMYEYVQLTVLTYSPVALTCVEEESTGLDGVCVASTGDLPSLEDASVKHHSTAVPRKFTSI